MHFYRVYGGVLGSAEEGKVSGGKNAYRVVGIGCVPRCGEQEDGMVVVGTEGLAVHIPEVVVRGVGAKGDVDGLCGGRLLQGGEGEEWSGLGQIVLWLVSCDLSGRTAKFC